MQNIINNLKEVWDLPYAREVLLVGATAVLTHSFDMRKLRKERKTKYQDKIGEKIAEALLAVRELVLLTKHVEIYQYSLDNSPVDSTKAIHEMVYYPAFMANRETFELMCGNIGTAREKYEQSLDLMSAAYLYVFERYLLNASLFAKRNGFLDSLDMLGLILIVDIQKWEDSFDRHLVKSINHPHYRLFSRHGKMWTLAKRYVEKKFLFNTELNKMMKISAEMKEDENHA